MTGFSPYGNGGLVRYCVLVSLLAPSYRKQKVAHDFESLNSAILEDCVE